MVNALPTESLEPSKNAPCSRSYCNVGAPPSHPLDGSPPRQRDGLLLRDHRVVGGTFLVPAEKRAASDELAHPPSSQKKAAQKWFQHFCAAIFFFSYSLKSITAETPTPSTRFTFVILMLSMGMRPLIRAILLNLNSSWPTAFTLSTWAFGPTTWTAPM